MILIRKDRINLRECKIKLLNLEKFTLFFKPSLTGKRYAFTTQNICFWTAKGIVLQDASIGFGRQDSDG